MSKLMEHTRVELDLAKVGLTGYGDLLPKAVLELMQVFADQRHSGGSASLTKQLFTKLANYEPLCPLTGHDDEWIDVGNGMYQNKRCSRVFKENGQAYDTKGIIWEDEDGNRFTNYESNTPVEFPYVPSSEVRPRPSENA